MREREGRRTSELVHLPFFVEKLFFFCQDCKTNLNNMKWRGNNICSHQLKRLKMKVLPPNILFVCLFVCLFCFICIFRKKKKCKRVKEERKKKETKIPMSADFPFSYVEFYVNPFSFGPHVHHAHSSSSNDFPPQQQMQTRHHYNVTQDFVETIMDGRSECSILLRNLF